MIGDSEMTVHVPHGRCSSSVSENLSELARHAGGGDGATSPTSDVLDI